MSTSTEMMKRLSLLVLLSLAGCVTAQVDRGPGPECDDINQRVLAAAANGDTFNLASREVQPALRNAAYVVRRMTDSMNVLDLDSVPRPVVLRYRVSPTGRTDKILVSRSSGSAAFDSIGVWVMGFAEHEPARIDGCPVPVWVELPLTATLPRRPRPSTGERP